MGTTGILAHAPRPVKASSARHPDLEQVGHSSAVLRRLLLLPSWHIAEPRGVGKSDYRSAGADAEQA